MRYTDKHKRKYKIHIKKTKIKTKETTEKKDKYKSKNHHKKYKTKIRGYDLNDIDKHIDEYLEELEKATDDYYQNYKKEIDQLKNNIKELEYDIDFEPDDDSDDDSHLKKYKNQHGGIFGALGSVIAAPFKFTFYTAPKGIGKMGAYVGRKASGVGSTLKNKISHAVSKTASRGYKQSVNFYRAIPGFRSGRIIRNSKGEKVFMSKGKTFFGREPSSTKGIQTRLNYINERIGGKRQKLDKLVGKVQEKAMKFESKIANLNHKILNTKDPKLIANYNKQILQFENQMKKSQAKFKDKIDAAEKKLKEKVDKYAKKTEELKKQLSEKVRKSEKRIREGFTKVCSKFGSSGKLGSELACQNAMRLCGGHTSKNPIEQTLECMNKNPDFKRLNISLGKGDLIEQMKKNAGNSWFRKDRHLKEIEKINSGKVSAAQNTIHKTEQRILDTDAYARSKGDKKFSNIIEDSQKEADQFTQAALKDSEHFDKALFSGDSQALKNLKMENLSFSKLQKSKYDQIQEMTRKEGLQQQAKTEIAKHKFKVSSVQKELDGEKNLLAEMERQGATPELLYLRQQRIDKLQKNLDKLKQAPPKPIKVLDELETTA